MVRNTESLRRFEQEFIRKTKVDINQNFRLIEAMYQEAVAMSVFPLKDSLSGLEIDIEIARVVNSVY